MKNPQWAGLVHPGESSRQHRIGGRNSEYLDRAGRGSCIGWGKASGATTAGGRKNQVSENTGDKGSRKPERSV